MNETKITLIFNSANLFETLVRKFNSDQNFSEILSGSVFALVARVVSAGLALFTSIIVARFYGAEAVGILAVVNSFLMLVTIFTVVGTSTSILRLIPEHITKYSVTSAYCVYRKTQFFVAMVSLLIGTVFYFGAGILADKVFSKPHLSFFFALASGFVIFKSLMDLNVQAVRGLLLRRTFAFMQVLPALAMISILLATTFLFRHPNNPVYAQLAAFVVTAMVGVFIMDRAFKRRVQHDDVVEPITLKEILSLSLPMLLSASMHFFIAQTGVIILGMFRTESEVGHYFIAVRLATMAAYVLFAVNSLAAPKFAQLYHSGKMDDLFHVAKKSSKLIFWTTTPILLVLIVLGKPILAFFFGESFVGVYPVMILVVFGQFVNSISGPTNNFLDMIGYQRVFMRIIVLSAVINVILNLALVPFFGIYGAAFTIMISLAFWNTCTLIYIKMKFGRTIGYVPLVRWN